MSSCPHDLTDMETAIAADGLCPLCLLAEVVRLKNNHKDVVRTKRRTNVRLKAAIDALQRIRHFPYVGQKAAQQMTLIADEGLRAAVSGGKQP